jgi:hypothetical protein
MIVANWTDKDILLLRKLVRADLSYAGIGEKLGRTKHAVARKIHDLDLPTRVVPNSGSQADRGARAKSSSHDKGEGIRAGKVTLPPLPSLSCAEQPHRKPACRNHC